MICTVRGRGYRIGVPVLVETAEPTSGLAASGDFVCRDKELALARDVLHEALAGARLSRREIVRRMRTSLPQLYRLLDPANTRKSINQLVALLHVLGCDVDVTVRRRQSAA